MKTKVSRVVDVFLRVLKGTGHSEPGTGKRTQLTIILQNIETEQFDDFICKTTMPSNAFFFVAFARKPETRTMTRF